MDSLYGDVDRDLAPGDVVGEYRIEDKIGQGGFGAVYRAVHPLIGKLAAVKVVNRELSKNPQMVSRFISEARAVNQIRHKNIIDIFSFGQLEDGRHYYVMELLDGVTFDRWLEGRTPMALADALPVLRGIARAMDAAHAKGILHRDLKPENVFVVNDEDGPVAKLLDFGLAKLITPEPSTSHHKTQTGTPMGTPYYMSPEQCRGHEVDARTDVYAFGAMCFEILTGSLPFDGDSAMDVLCKHMQDAPPRASERAAVGSAFDAPLAQLMAKEPSERPASIGEALAMLEAAAGLPSSTRAVPAVSVRASSSQHIDERVQTMLATEADVSSARAPSPSKLPLVGLGAAMVLAVGLVGGLVMMRKHSAPPISSGITQTPSMSAPPAAISIGAIEQPPKPTTALLHLEGLPSGATVTVEGKPVDASKAIEVARSKTVEVVVTAKGFKTKTLSLTPDHDTTVPIELEKTAKPASTLHKDLESF